MEIARPSATPEEAPAARSIDPRTGERLQRIIDQTYARFKDVDDGAVATYIPELGKANPKDFGICLVTVDGQVFTAGDWEKEFTIQSMCKPFAFQMALERLGTEKVLRHVGVEPSGEAFNSIEFDPKSGRPFNPMVNAGAIAVASLLKQRPVQAGVDAFLRQMGRAAGRELRIDESVLASETGTGNRNRAIAYMLLNSGVIDEEVLESLHQYFAQCSMLVNCRDLAMMAATMANIGNQPRTGETVFDFQHIKHVLAVMFSCGLYDYAGNWAFEVGLPAKSGVSGGIFAVVNRQLGIGVYSPKLDGQGNSVRGILACKELANRFGLHAFEFSNVGSSFMQWVL
ncbi:glutaminase A [Acidobacteria bacterium AB60]|nr:glutaminase A [Acidobacteria bacterium AB60]